MFKNISRSKKFAWVISGVYLEIISCYNVMVRLKMNDVKIYFDESRNKGEIGYSEDKLNYYKQRYYIFVEVIDIGKNRANSDFDRFRECSTQPLEEYKCQV